MGLFSKSRGYKEGQVMRDNPVILKQLMAERDARQMKGVLAEAFGSAAQAAVPEQTAAYQMGGDEMMEGEQPIQGLMNITQEAQPAQAGSGLLGSAGSPEESRYLQAMKALSSQGGVGGTQQANKMLSAMQNSVMGGMNARGRSPTTFEIGAGNGMKQRAYFDEGNNVVPMGDPYRAHAPQAMTSYAQKVADLQSGDPARVASAREAMRKQMYETELGYVDNSGQDRFIDKQVAEGEFVKGMARDDTKFYNAYGNANQTLENSLYDLGRMTDSLSTLSGMTDYTTTGFANYLKYIPATDAKAWEDVKDTVLNNIALDKMMELKSLSASGATGFGALSERELGVLTDNLGKLDGTSDPKEIKRIIGLINTSLERNKRNIQQAMDRNTTRHKGIDKRYSRYKNVNRTKEGTMQGQGAPASAPAAGVDPEFDAWLKAQGG